MLRMTTCVLTLCFAAFGSLSAEETTEKDDRELRKTRAESRTILAGQELAADLAEQKAKWFAEMKKSGAFVRHEKKGAKHFAEVGAAFHKLPASDQQKVAEYVYRQYVSKGNPKFRVPLTLVQVKDSERITFAEYKPGPKGGLTLLKR